MGVFKHFFYALLWIWELYKNFGPPLIMKISVVNSLTPFSVFGFPWKLLTASVQFTPYTIISVLQTTSFFLKSQRQRDIYLYSAFYSKHLSAHAHSDWPKTNLWCLSYNNIIIVGGRFAIKIKPGVTPKLEVMLLPQSSL